jgi:hypothetical protein
MVPRLLLVPVRLNRASPAGGSKMDSKETEPIDLSAHIKGQRIEEIYLDPEQNVLIELSSGVMLKFPFGAGVKIGVPVPQYIN